jgi:hypothetical protein
VNQRGIGFLVGWGESGWEMGHQEMVGSLTGFTFLFAYSQGARLMHPRFTYQWSSRAVCRLIDGSVARTRILIETEVFALR